MEDMSELQRSMGRVEGELAILTAELRVGRQAVEKRLDLHEVRLDHIELWKSRVKGYVAGILAVATALLTLLKVFHV
jgi:hydroxymethylglutaryl-CoA reductase